MKRIITITCLLLTLGAAAQDVEQAVKSDIKDVTVFLRGAQITREAKVTIPSGKTTLVFEGLAQYLNASSIQVEGTSDFTIVSVNHRTNYIDVFDNNEVVDQLHAEQDDLRFKVAQRESMRGVYTEERDLLLKNQDITSEQEGLDLDDLMFYADFYRERLLSIEYELIEIDSDVAELNEEINEIQKELNQLSASRNVYTSEVLVSVSATKSTTATLKVNYIVDNAGWVPYYDVRAQDTKSSIKLTYKASVYQNTGKDWKNVNITLSTGNPTQSGNPPIISPWILSFAEDLYYGHGLANTTMGYDAAPYGSVSGEMAYNYSWDNSSSQYVTSVASSVSTEFVISIPYSIPADGQYHDVEVQQNALAVEYNYYSAPKLDQDAFLLAKISGWEDYNLLPGNANIYFKGTYVGQSYLNTQTTRDTLELSLGRDKDVVIDREKVKDFSKSGSKNSVTVDMVITVRNTKSVTVIMDMEDQIPISEQKDIVITLKDNGNASVNENSGKLSWEVILGPGETQTFEYSYEIKYPKDMELSGF